MRARIAPLRSQHVFPSVRLALLRAGRRDPERFRVLQFSVQRDHIHLVVEAADKRALSSGLQGLAIRVARYVNDLLGRRGPLWADRWHGRALKTPREVRNALAYVLGNFRKHHGRTAASPYGTAASPHAAAASSYGTAASRHGASPYGTAASRHGASPYGTAASRRGASPYRAAASPHGTSGSAAWGIDPYSSGEWFDGWREWKPSSGAPPPFAEVRRWRWRRATSARDEAIARVTAEPETWLASAGWQRHGLVGLGEAPRVR